MDTVILVISKIVIFCANLLRRTLTLVWLSLLWIAWVLQEKQGHDLLGGGGVKSHLPETGFYYYIVFEKKKVWKKKKRKGGKTTYFNCRHIKYEVFKYLSRGYYLSLLF